MEIQDYPNYLIYDDGRVFSKKNNRFLSCCPNSNGYICYNLGREMKSFKAHRLVAQHYIPNPENKGQVDHINRQKDDNRKENLRWVTSSENQQNTCLRKNNKIGIKNICYEKSQNRYRYHKTINGKNHRKNFKTLQEAIDYKNQFEDLTIAPVLPIS